MAPGPSTAAKRALSASQSSQSQSQSATSRPAKRPRVVGPSSSAASLIADPGKVATKAQESPQTRSGEASDKGNARPAKELRKEKKAAVRLPPPKKRTHHPGHLRRLSTGHPSLSSHAANDSSLSAAQTQPRPRVRDKATLAGAKIGGRSKDLRDGVEAEAMWIRRPKQVSGKKAGADGLAKAAAKRQGLGYAGYLKIGVAAFVERGCTTLSLHAVGAAIPLCLSLSLAIRDAIPGGEPDADEGAAAPGGEVNNSEPLVRMDVRTGSKQVHDEITPDDEDDDIMYQTRTKSTVSVTLSLSEPLRSSLGPAKRKGVRTAAGPGLAAGAGKDTGRGQPASRRGRRRGGVGSEPART